MPIYLQHGNLIDYVPPTDTTTEDVVFMGGLVGVPQTFIPAGELGALSVDGVYIFNKKDGVSVNLGEVVKYCGTTKLAQDRNADLTLGVAVADAEANDFGVKVKINSVLPTEGGGGGGEVVIDTTRGLSENSSGIGINIGTGLKFDCGGEVAFDIGSGLEFSGCSGIDVKIGTGLSFGSNGELGVDIMNGCGLEFIGGGNKLGVKVATNGGLDFNSNGELVATGGGGGSEVAIDTSRGLSETGSGIGINIGTGLSFGSNGELNATGGGGGGEVAVCNASGLYYDHDGNLAICFCGRPGYTVINTDQGGLYLRVCTASGLIIDENGYLTYTG